MGPTFVPLTVTLAVLLGGQALLLLFVILVAARKFARDRRERASMHRRGELASSLHRGAVEQLDTVLRACMRSEAELADLMHVLRHGERLPDGRIAELHRAAQRVGLTGHLSRQLGGNPGWGKMERVGLEEHERAAELSPVGDPAPLQ